MIKKSIKQRVKEFFFVNPTIRLRVRGIERQLGLSLPSVIQSCKDLEQEGILQIIKIENIRLYAANTSNNVFILQKRLFNIYTLFSCGLVDQLIKELSNPTIKLFGSYEKGEDIESSDIDIFIQTKSIKKLNLEKYEKKLNRKIQLFQVKDISDLKNKHLMNNISNGFSINKSLEVF